jgi:SET domain-containing protein
MVEGQCKVLKLGAKCSSCIRTTKMDHKKGENPKSGTVIHEELSEHFLMQLK